MTQLAIKGHETRGSEVIELLEMLGGWNCYHWDGNASRVLYFIDDGVIVVKAIRHNTNIDEFNVFTLEEFLDKCPYKVGDVVRTTNNEEGVIKEISWVDNDIAYSVNIVKTYNLSELFLVRESCNGTEFKDLQEDLNYGHEQQ